MLTPFIASLAIFHHINPYLSHSSVGITGSMSGISAWLIKVELQLYWTNFTDVKLESINQLRGSSLNKYELEDSRLILLLLLLVTSRILIY